MKQYFYERLISQLQKSPMLIYVKYINHRDMAIIITFTIAVINGTKYVRMYPFLLPEPKWVIQILSHSNT